MIKILSENRIRGGGGHRTVCIDFSQKFNFTVAAPLFSRSVHNFHIARRSELDAFIRNGILNLKANGEQL